MVVQCIVGQILCIRPIDFCDEYVLFEYFKETLGKNVILCVL